MSKVRLRSCSHFMRLGWLTRNPWCPSWFISRQFSVSRKYALEIFLVDHPWATGGMRPRIRLPHTLRMLYLSMVYWIHLTEPVISNNSVSIPFVCTVNATECMRHSTGVVAIESFFVLTLEAFVIVFTTGLLWSPAFFQPISIESSFWIALHLNKKNLRLYFWIF